MGGSNTSLPEKRTEWLEILHGNDRHAIINQLIQMTWDAASFRMINESRGLAPIDKKGEPELSGLMYSLINRGFFATFIVAVRRLMDASSPRTGPKGVYSLSILFADMKAHRHLLTRKAILEAEEIPYDFESIQDSANAYASGMYLRMSSERRHKMIDVLADVAPGSRQPEDTLQEAVFLNLEAKASKACEAIAAHATKFIAHASTPESRATLKIQQVPTLGMLWKAHKHLCQVAGFLTICVLGASCPGFLPTPQYDQFRYIERPLISEPLVEHLCTRWHDFHRECQDWSQWGLEEYTQEF